MYTASFVLNTVCSSRTHTSTKEKKGNLFVYLSMIIYFCRPLWLILNHLSLSFGKLIANLDLFRDGGWMRASFKIKLNRITVTGGMIIFIW